MTFEDKNAKPFLVRVFNSAGLAIFLSLLVFLGLKDFTTIYEALGAASVVLIFFTFRSIVWCREYIEKLIIDEHKLTIEYFKFYKKHIVRIDRKKLVVQLKGVPIKGKMYKLLIFEGRHLQITQYQLEYWNYERLIEISNILAPPPKYAKFK